MGRPYLSPMGKGEIPARFDLMVGTHWLSIGEGPRGKAGVGSYPQEEGLRLGPTFMEVWTNSQGFERDIAGKGCAKMSWF